MLHSNGQDCLGMKICLTHSVEFVWTSQIFFSIIYGWNTDLVEIVEPKEEKVLGKHHCAFPVP